MNRMELNTYLYAPKDDYKHRLQWRQPYNEEEAGNILDKLTLKTIQWVQTFVNVYGIFTTTKKNKNKKL